jgi:hypothetical protein
MTNFIEEGLAVVGVGTASQELGDYLQYSGVQRDAPLKIDFSWSPSTNVAQACGSINLTVPETHINTAITYTLIQNATIDHYVEAINWDFGDGTITFYDNHPSFSGMTHTFTVANFQNSVTMVAIDNYGNEYVVTHPNYLVV